MVKISQIVKFVSNFTILVIYVGMLQLNML